MYIIGLMGGIASGKTYISKYLMEKGADIIDADLVARDLQKPGTEAAKKIREAFGDEFFTEDGELMRAALGAHVFGDDEKLSILNSIMHPLIDKEIKNRLKKYENSNSQLIVIDAAILFDSLAYDLCDEVWLVTADKEERIRRLAERNGLNREMAKARIKSQRPDEELSKYADHIIITEGTVEETRRHVDVLLEEICKKNNIFLNKRI